MTPLFRILCFAAFGATATPVAAQQIPNTGSVQENVVLVADSVSVSNDNRLIAKGNVEALQGDVRVRAKQIEYDGNLGIVRVTGPIHLSQGDHTQIVASYGELDTDFRNGLLKSARVVLNQQLQMATNQLDRVDDRYNVLTKTTVSSCRVCDQEYDSPPLWQIRAQRVVHDQLERQIYFDHAQVRVLDVPIFYFPQLRLPDPTLDRSKGFLIPEINQNSLLGFGAKVPYFFPIGDDKDLTLTPYLAQNTRTMEFRYRQAFRKGGIEFNGAVSDDDVNTDQPRFYLFGEGNFDLARDYKLTFDIKATSDDAYLLDYDYSDEDRLESDITVRRVKRDENTRFALIHYESLRATEDNDTIPTIIAVAETERRFFPTAIGGEGRWSVQTQHHHRTSNLDYDSGDSDSIVDGRDVTRASANLWWRRNWTMNSGLRAGVTTQLAFDAFQTDDDATRDGFESQFTPTIQADLRYPLSKVTPKGVSYVIEPVAMIGYSGGDTLNVANDESSRVEFDEGNLLSLSRFPSGDRRERGAQAAIGLNWSRIDPNGWQGKLTFGQVYQADVHSDFTTSSGLSQSPSDILLAGQFRNKSGLTLTARGLFDGFHGVNKASAHASWSNDKLWLEGSYVWLGVDPDEDRTETVAEWTIDSRYRLSRHWTGLLDWRYDVSSEQSAEAGVGLEYQNECVRIGLTLSRSYITTSNVEPSTDVGLTISFLGFSVNAKDKSYHRTCNNAG
ncbi:LPS assembly protein LptD [Shimia thalassica]|uniref:LPS-assembly protein LptD n=1 Tax=Shimia thalassica TaxID=1715693 RepID=UPI00273528D3|nr:LPS assembly protein LptD [Shimia thalassica]MDP2495148.1 LPS assembly protein LptD [Shimia thalassica]